MSEKSIANAHVDQNVPWILNPKCPRDGDALLCRELAMSQIRKEFRTPAMLQTAYAASPNKPCECELKCLWNNQGRQNNNSVHAHQLSKMKNLLCLPRPRAVRLGAGRRCSRRYHGALSSISRGRLSPHHFVGARCYGPSVVCGPGVPYPCVPAICPKENEVLN